MSSKYDTPSSEVSISPAGNSIAVTPKKSGFARRRMFSSPGSSKIAVTNEKSPLGCSTIPPTPDSDSVGSPRRSPRLSKFASTPRSANAQTAQTTALRVKRKLMDDSVIACTEGSKKAKQPSASPKQKQKTTKMYRVQQKRIHGGINKGVSHGIKRPKLKPLRDPKPLQPSKKAKMDVLQQRTSDEPASLVAVNEDVGKTEVKSEPQNNGLRSLKPEPSDKIIKNNPKIIVTTKTFHGLPPGKDSGPKKFFKSRENEKPSRVATVSLNNNLKLELREAEAKQTLRRSPRKHKTLEKIVSDLVNDWDEKEDGVPNDITNIIDKLEISPKNTESMDVLESSKGFGSSVMEVQCIEEKVPKNVQNSEARKLFPIFQKRAKHDDESLKSRSDNTQVHMKQWTRGRSDGPSQCILDAGQKVFGAITCSQCGLLYHAKDPDDEILHAKLHDSLHSCLKFPGWKNEHVVRNYGPEGQVIVVSPRDAAHCWRKVNDVLSKVVDVELGFSEIGIRKPDHTRVYFYVTEKKIVGVLVAERISRAYRILPAVGKQTGRCCSDVPENVLVGVSRIWTLGTHRRLKIASRLVDSIRADFIFGQVIDVSQIAFSDPTESGVHFAEKYMKRGDFLVYNM